jgi:hypothetical protein
VKLLALALVALVAAAAASAASPGDPKKVIIPAVQAKAKAINVQRSDLTNEKWKANPPSKSQGNPRCSYYNPNQSNLTENGDADSPEFTLPSSSFVSSNTSIFKTATQGRTAYARVVQPKLPKCLAEIFRKGAAPTKVTIVSAKEVSFPKLAERSNAYRIVASFKSGSRKIAVYLDVVVMNRGKVDAVVFFAGIGQVFNDAFERSVTAKVAARTKNA